MANRPGGKAPLSSTPKSAVAKAKPRSGGRFTPTGGKTITAASASSTGGKSIANYYNSGKASTGERVRKALPSQAPVTPTKQGGGQQPPRQYTGGKYVPGYSPPGFGGGLHQRQNYDDGSESEQDDTSSDEDEEAEAEVQPEAQAEYEDDNEDVFDDRGVRVKKEPKLGEEDSEFQPEDEFEDVGEEDPDYTIIEDFNPRARGGGNGRGRGGGMSQGSSSNRGNSFTNRVTYKKKIRKDSSRFTTTTAMIDADDEFHPKVAAFMGRKIVGGGNGRKGGRKLIRWTPATDQLLLLCFHHELAMMRDDLPYEQVAERMFPEKCATGGAVKERFAKLRIEMLNRGSWVPPIIGKSPQGIRPNVRGVVRVAPGVDKGRYVLWKEDASKLIDPKDVMKGYAGAQARGLEAPGRVWISNEAKKEFYAKKAELEARGLRPLADVPVDNDEDEDNQASMSDRRNSWEDEQDQDQEKDEGEEDEVVETPIRPVAATPTRKRKLQNAPTPAAKRSAAAKSRGRDNKAASIEDDDVFAPRDGSPRPRPRRTPQKAPARATAPSPEAGLRGVEFITKLQKSKSGRHVLVLAGVPTRVLAKFEGGQHGPGSDKYFLDEVIDKTWAGKENPETEEADDIQSVQVKPDEVKDPNKDPDHVLFNSGINVPSDDPFWKADMEIDDLMNIADKIVDGGTRPADIIKQVFDGKRFWDVDEVIAEYKANTNPTTGLALDVNIWYRCATILRHATSGEQHETANVDKLDPGRAQAPTDQHQFQDYHLFPDQGVMNSLNMDAGGNAHGMNPFQALDYGSADATHGGLTPSGVWAPMGSEPFPQFDMGGFDNGGNSGQNMFAAGDMNMGGLDHFDDDMAAVPPIQDMTPDQIDAFLDFSGVKPVAGGDAGDSVAPKSTAKDEVAVPEAAKADDAEPDVQMS